MSWSKLKLLCCEHPPKHDVVNLGSMTLDYSIMPCTIAVTNQIVTAWPWIQWTCQYRPTILTSSLAGQKQLWFQHKFRSALLSSHWIWQLKAKVLEAVQAGSKRLISHSSIDACSERIKLPSMVIKNFVIIEKAVFLIIVHHPVTILTPECRTLRCAQIVICELLGYLDGANVAFPQVCLLLQAISKKFIVANHCGFHKSPTQMAVNVKHSTNIVIQYRMLFPCIRMIPTH